MDNENREQFKFDDDLMALAGLSAPAPGLHSEDSMPAAGNDDNATRIDAPKIEAASPQASTDNKYAAEKKAKKTSDSNDIADLFDNRASLDNSLTVKGARQKFDLPAVLENLAKKSEINRCIEQDSGETGGTGSSETNRRVSSASSKRVSRTGAKRVPRSSSNEKHVSHEDAPKTTDAPNEAETAAIKPDIAQPQPNEVTQTNDEPAKLATDDAPCPTSEKQDVATPGDHAQEVPATNDVPQRESKHTEAALLLKDDGDLACTHDDEAEKDDSEELIEPHIGARRFTQEIVTRGRSMSHSLMNIGGTKQRSGRFWMALFSACVIIVLVVTLAHYKHREIMIGYELSTAINEREALLEENRRLRIELRVINSHERLDAYKDRQLGLQPIAQDQIIFINHKPRNHEKSDAK